MKKIYAVTKRYKSGFECFWNYFPSREAMQKMHDEEVADNPHAACQLLVEEIELPSFKGKDLDYNYKDKLETKDGYDIYWILSDCDSREVFADVPVIDFKYDDRPYWAINHSRFVLDITREEARKLLADYVEAKTELKVQEYRKYLETPFAKEWLQKMQYTVKEDEYGHKFVFLAILCGYGKISDESFQKLCEAVCWVNFRDDLSMCMWIGGKVNWTMFYERPDHVNGHETFFCGVVCQDDFSPEDFDRDHSDYSFANAKHHS